MARDPRNELEQYTWKQWKAKVQNFKNCPSQYAQFLKKRKAKGVLRLSDEPMSTLDDM